jgi:hypothetical protein
MLWRLPTKAFQADIVGEMFAKYQEHAEQCLYLKNFGSRAYDLILGLGDDWVRPTVRLEEAIEQPQLMHEEHREAIIELRALQSSTTRVRHLVLRGSDETSSLATSLSSAADLIEGRINVAATNGVHWGLVGTDCRLVTLPRVGA